MTSKNLELAAPALTAWVCFTCLFFPWLLIPAAGLFGYKWIKKWRYHFLQPVDKKLVFNWEWLEWYGLMFIGYSADRTIRWWYTGYNGTLIPQSVRTGKFYWNASEQIDDPELVRHLKGFYEMGLDWLSLCKTQSMKKKNKNKSKKKVVEEIAAVPEENAANPIDKAASAISQATAAMAQWAESSELEQLKATVDDLKKEIEGRCPTIKFDVDT